MTIFEEREKAFETKYASEQKAAFVARARQSKALGLWAARKMGLPPEAAEDYALGIVRADVEQVGQDDVLMKVAADLKAKQIPATESDVRAELGRLSKAAATARG